MSHHLPYHLAFSCNASAGAFGALAKSRKETAGSVMSVRPHGTTRAPTGRTFVKF